MSGLEDKFVRKFANGDKPQVMQPCLIIVAIKNVINVEYPIIWMGGSTRAVSEDISKCTTSCAQKGVEEEMR